MTQAELSLTANTISPTLSFSTESKVDEKSKAVESMIRGTGHAGLSHVRAVTADGWIVLRGTVASFYLKQLAQEAVRPLAIGMQIQNDIDVTN